MRFGALKQRSQLAEPWISSASVKAPGVVDDDNVTINRMREHKIHLLARDAALFGLAGAPAGAVSVQPEQRRLVQVLEQFRKNRGGVAEVLAHV